MSKEKAYKVAVVGGGAAGFFAALSVMEHHPSAQVTILEKTQKLLAKVKVSGGGRCNVTNGTTSIAQLSKAYPRGEKKLKKGFKFFNTVDTMQWFESRGVALMTQEDNCVFPVSQDSQSIIDCFLEEARRLGIIIKQGARVEAITEVQGQLKLTFKKDYDDQSYDKVIVATGGSPKRSGLEWLEALGHNISEPVPSLFTFNMPSESIVKLMGIVVENARVKIEGSKLVSDGPLLITHWGMSGPAILKLSAFGARILSERDYKFSILVNWVNVQNNNEVLLKLQEIIASHPQKLLSNYRPYGLPDRLWQYLIAKGGFSGTKIWSELGKTGLNKLINLLCNDRYQVEGKTTYKEEFVTCGGISLASINMTTMESQCCKNLYFAGEVMDIDGITGGYNFQSAWTTGYQAGKLISL